MRRIADIRSISSAKLEAIPVTLEVAETPASRVLHQYKETSSEKVY